MLFRSGLFGLLLVGCTVGVVDEEKESAHLATAESRAELPAPLAAEPQPAPMPAGTPGVSCIAASDADNLEADNLAKYGRYRDRQSGGTVVSSAGTDSAPTRSRVIR